MNADMSNDNRRTASTTAVRNDDVDDLEDNTATTMTTPTTAPPIGGLGLFRSGHDAGSQALALAA